MLPQGADDLHAELEAQAAALEALRRDIGAAETLREAEQEATFARCASPEAVQMGCWG